MWVSRTRGWDPGFCRCPDTRLPDLSGVSTAAATAGLGPGHSPHGGPAALIAPLLRAWGEARI